MLRGERIKLEIYMDLDPVPGAFATKESAREQTERILKEAIPWYNPEVKSE